MDSSEARALVVRELAKYRARSYGDLQSLIGHQDTYEVAGASGVIYQLEILAFWDGSPNDVLRVRGAIDDGGVRAFVPMTEDFLIAPDGTFIDD